MSFEDKTETKKGYYGECLVNAYLLSKHWFPYKPAISGSHPFDGFAHNGELCKDIAYDVKCKSERIKYPDTGIDIRFFKEYQKVTGVPFVLFFVDDDAGKIYGNTLENLMKPITIDNLSYPQIAPKNSKGVVIIYFPMVHMQTFTTISEKDCIELKKLDTKQEEYKPSKEESDWLDSLG